MNRNIYFSGCVLLLIKFDKLILVKSHGISIDIDSNLRINIGNTSPKFTWYWIDTKFNPVLLHTTTTWYQIVNIKKFKKKKRGPGTKILHQVKKRKNMRKGCNLLMDVVNKVWETLLFFWCLMGKSHVNNLRSLSNFYVPLKIRFHICSVSKRKREKKYWLKLKSVKNDPSLHHTDSSYQHETIHTEFNFSVQGSPQLLHPPPKDQTGIVY